MAFVAQRFDGRADASEGDQTVPSFHALTARVAALVLAAGALLSACQVNVEQPRPVPPPGGGGGGGFCTREYLPVCGSRGSRYQTFGNACEAREAGFRIAYNGECRGGPGGGGGGPGGGGGGDQGFCTREYAPVCAKRGSRYQTFSNSCEAEQAGFRIISDGECRGPGGGGGGGGGGVAVDKSCPKDLNPVCARRGSDVRTFANDCRAEEAGFQVMYPGECR